MALGHELSHLLYRLALTSASAKPEVRRSEFRLKDL